MRNTSLKISEEKKCELLRELKDLKDLKLPEIADRLESSRNNDLSEEDIELSKILEEKETVKERISEIDEILRTAQIYKHEGFCMPDKVELGSIVKIKQGRKTLDVKIVPSIESNPSRNYISEKSPLGIALLESKVGEKITVTIRNLKTKYKIIEIC